MAEIQVYRISPIEGKYYYTTTWTRKEGVYPNETYYSKNPLRYVGKFITHHQYGYGDGATHYDIFEDGDTVNHVNYTYEGTTSFVETEPPLVIIKPVPTIPEPPPTVSEPILTVSEPPPVIIHSLPKVFEPPLLKSKKRGCCCIS